MAALGMYFPYMEIFMPIFIFLLGYTTIIAYFHIGHKCMLYLFPKVGSVLYYVYALGAFILFSFANQLQALLLMSFCGVGMLLLNLYAIIYLYDEVEL